MDPSTITFVAGVISCIIGVATFITGIASRARNDGNLEAKLGFCLQGIDELKERFVSFESKQGSHNDVIIRHDAEIKALQKDVSELKEKVNKIGKQ